MVTLAEEHALRRKATLNGHAVVTFYDVVVKSNKVDEKIQTVKANREWRVEYMTLLMREQEIAETEREEGRKEGRKEGNKEGKKEDLRNICEKLGMSLQQAMDVLNIPENERNSLILERTFDALTVYTQS